MGQRGPAALPANVHLLRGNPSKKPLTDLLSELQPEVELPDFPSWLLPEAKKEWKRIGAELVKYGLVSKLDRAALVLYVQAWARMVWAERQLSRAMDVAEKKRREVEAAGGVYEGTDGIMVATPNGGLQYSHYYVVQKNSAHQVKMFLEQFGMSPSSRSKVTPSDNRQQQLFAPATESEFQQI